jgi:starch synthase
MRDGVDGVMVDPADGEEGFANALGRLLDDTELAREMGAAGRERALATFSWKVIGDQLETLYESVVGRSRSVVEAGTIP